MSKGSTFTPVGAETNKIISRILEKRSGNNFNTLNRKEILEVRGNDNTPNINSSASLQLNLFEHAVGS